MKKVNLTCILLIFLGIYSCKKEETKTPLSAQTASNISADEPVCRSEWTGEFDQNKPERTIFTTDNKMIFDGYAHVMVPPKFTRNVYVTKMILNTPDCAVVDGDNVRMSISVMNPTDSVNSQYTNSVYVYMYGSTDSAYVEFNGYYSKFTKIGVGHYYQTGLEGLHHLFSTYEVVSLVAKDHIISAYIGGNLIGEVPYTGTNIGQLQRIAIGFRGSGYVDYVKLYNSTTSALVMKEDFNVTHKSTDTWY
ncbi:MAG: hypothetical protein ABJB05_04870 [Parafilimonas sp.]